MSEPSPDPEIPARRWRRGHTAVALTLVILAAAVVLGISSLDLPRIGEALVGASPGWVLASIGLMAISLVMRSLSWHQTLRAALPDTPMPWPPVLRATMIGVMASAVFPGRVGEPLRIVVLSRRLDGSNKTLVPIVAGTVFSQTLINILALVLLAAITFTEIPALHGHLNGIETVLALPLAVAVLVILGPRLLALARRSRWERLRRGGDTVARALVLARRGLIVFARPRYGLTAVSAQLIAWGLQWLACYMVILALGLQSHAGLATAAAILLAINVSAVLPATPSNVGVFQAACLVVLAASGVGAGPGLAYGIILQAVEVLTALMLGIPALLREGLRWSDLRPSRQGAPENIEP
jgi:phosphatidylinositol alpha-mannosyltransferase